MSQPIAELYTPTKLDPLARPPITSNIQYFTSKTINTTHIAKDSNTLLSNSSIRKFSIRQITVNFWPKEI